MLSETDEFEDELITHHSPHGQDMILNNGGSAPVSAMKKRTCENVLKNSEYFGGGCAPALAMLKHSVR